jgi:cyclase
VRAVLSIPLTVGGGVRRVDDAWPSSRPAPTRSGVNTAAVERPEILRELADLVGAQCVVLAIDAARRRGRRRLGGRHALGDATGRASTR